MSLPQHSRLIAKIDFNMRRSLQSKPIAVRAGQEFWVTNSTTAQQSGGFVLIDRKGKGVISEGYPFKEATLETLFDIRRRA